MCLSLRVCVIALTMPWKSSSFRSHHPRSISVHRGIILAFSAPAPVSLLSPRSSFCNLQKDADSAPVGLAQAWMLSAMADISPASNLHKARSISVNRGIILTMSAPAPLRLLLSRYSSAPSQVYLCTQRYNPCYFSPSSCQSVISQIQLL